jgi:hypothetical protein
LQLAATAAIASVLYACDGCGTSADLQVAGATPYVRCLAGTPPPDGTRRVGAIRVESREGHMRLAGFRAPLTLAAFSGPALGAPPRESELTALRAAAPQLLLMLGGLGDGADVATATLEALAELGIPIAILAGGRDSPDRFRRALKALEDAPASRVIDLTGARSLRIGDDMLVPVAGALDGRYALDDGSCGYASSDLDALADALPDGPARRWLIAWEAPSGGGEAAVSRTADGLNVGSGPLAELGREIGAAGGLFAWPHVQVLRPSAGRDHRRVAIGGPAERDLRLVVPRLSGPPMERSDGSRVAPGFALLELGTEGLRVVSVHPATARAE